MGRVNIIQHVSQGARRSRVHAEPVSFRGEVFRVSPTVTPEGSSQTPKLTPAPVISPDTDSVNDERLADVAWMPLPDAPASAQRSADPQRETERRPVLKTKPVAATSKGGLQWGFWPDGDSLVELREKAGLSHRELAQRTGLATDDLRKFERGLSKLYRHEALRLADGLRMGPDDLHRAVRQ